MNVEKLSCDEAARIMSEGLDTVLPPQQRERLRAHVAICQACQRIERQFEMLRRLTRGAEPAADDAPAD